MASLTRISPASAVASIITVMVAAGPVTISSRCDPPTRKKSNFPLWTPTDIRSTTRCSSTRLTADVAQRPAHLHHGPAGPHRLAAHR